MKKTYRARMEWDGIEIFDQKQGRVMSTDHHLVNMAGELQNNSSLDHPYAATELFQKIVSSKIVHENNWHIEPLIDTPYPKTQAFASAPRRVYWEFTRKCNLNCKSCFNRSFGAKEELSTLEILSLADTMYKSGVYELRCTGGEPTVRRDFIEIIHDLKRMGFYLSMGTNGIYSKSTLNQLMAAPVDWIIISVDGAQESTYSEIRGDGIFHKVLQTIEELASKGCRLRINTLIRKTNYTYDHLKGLAELCDNYSVESLNCIPLRPVTNDPETLKQQLTPLQFRDFIADLNRLRQEYSTDFVTTLDLRHTNTHDRIYFKDRSCAAGREGAVISPYGEIYGCSYSLASDPNVSENKRERYVAGNVLEQDFLDIWNQSEKWAIYRDLKKYKHEKCQSCNYYIARRCIGSCPIMDKGNPAASIGYLLHSRHAFSLTFPYVF
ncbi:MAG: radical SAM protein, partial [Nitrospirae bacterium]|nr:radical SAM protein [Nitrospirota bacterium]